MTVTFKLINVNTCFIKNVYKNLYSLLIADFVLKKTFYNGDRIVTTKTVTSITNFYTVLF